MSSIRIAAYGLGKQAALEKMALLGEFLSGAAKALPMIKGLATSATPAAIRGGLTGALSGAATGGISSDKGEGWGGAGRGALYGGLLGALSGGALGAGRTYRANPKGTAELGRMTARTKGYGYATDTKPGLARPTTARNMAAYDAARNATSTHAGLIGTGGLGGLAGGYMGRGEKEPWQDKLKALPNQAYEGLLR